MPRLVPARPRAGLPARVTRAAAQRLRPGEEPPEGLGPSRSHPAGVRPPRWRAAPGGLLPARLPALLPALLAFAFALAGCGLGAGEEVGDVELTVTRDYGATTLVSRWIGGVSESDTVVRVLERNAEVGTRYGGGFVQKIQGLTGSTGGEGSRDWFFFVDGVESPVGAADYRLRGGEQVWWDYRDWGATNRVPAVVGSWPAPLRGGYEGESHPVVLECRGGAAACAVARARLRRAGISLDAGGAAGAIRVLVGPWRRLSADPAAAQLGDGVQESGVFARFLGGHGGVRLQGLREDGAPGRVFGPRAGLVAATRRYEEPPVWLVTGSEAAGVAAAARALGPESLRNRYAVAVEGGRVTPLPLREAG